MSFILPIRPRQYFLQRALSINCKQVSEIITGSILRSGSSVEVPDASEIERALRSDLQAALGRLHRARAQLAAASSDAQIPIGSFRAAAEERAAALRELESASLRFAEFVLNGVIPPDLGSPVSTCRSTAKSRR